MAAHFGCERVMHADDVQADTASVERKITGAAPVAIAHDLVVILGADTAAGLASWVRGEEIMKRARIAVVPRPGSDAGAVEAAIDEPFTWLDMPLLGVSGTQ